MRVNLPHQLGREEVRHRMRTRSHEIADYFPSGMASVDTDWPEEDVMNLTVDAMGQTITGTIEVYDDHVVVDLSLPAMLGFLRGTIEAAIRKKGTKLLE